MLSRTTTFLASIVVIATFSACSTPYSDVYSFKKNKFQAPKEKKTEISLPAAAANPLQGQTAPMTELGIPGVQPATPLPGIPGLEAAPAAPGAMPIEAVPATPPATTPVPAPTTPPATTPAPGTTPAIPGL